MSNPEKISKLHTYLKIFESSGILIGAIWTFYLYLSFQKEDNKTKLEQQRISLQQQKLVLDQSKLTNTAEVESKRISAQLLDLNYKIQNATANFEIKKVELSSKQVEIENKLKLEELQYLSQSTIQGGFRDSIIWLDSISNGWTDYRIIQRFDVKNTSKNKFDIFEANVEVYLGELTKEPEYEHAVVLNTPDRKGAIKWEMEKSYTFLSIERYQEIQKQMPNYTYDLIGGAAIGRLQSGEESFYADELKIRIKKRKWIFSRITIHVDEGSKKWLHKFFDFKSL